MHYSFLPASLLMLMLPWAGHSQNVGIGTSNPTKGRLEVAGAVGYTAAIFGTDGAGISLERNWPTVGFNQYNDGTGRYMSTGFAALQFMNPATGEMGFDMLGSGSANSATVTPIRGLSIASNGNVGVRTGAYPNASLYVPRYENANGALVIVGTQWSSHFYYSSAEETYIRAGKNNGKVIINDIPGGKVTMGNGTGRFGINSSNPIYTLEVNQAPSGGGLLLLSPDWYYTNWELKNEVYSIAGQTSCLELVYNGNSIKGWFRPDNGQYSANSDRRLKRNIADMEPVLDRIMQLRSTRYEMKDNNPEHKKSVGFIAQEIEPLFPEVVDRLQTKPDSLHPGRLTDQYGINYGSLSVVAIKAIQEQQLQIKRMEQEINLLKEQNMMLLKIMKKK